VHRVKGDDEDPAVTGPVPGCSEKEGRIAQPRRQLSDAVRDRLQRLESRSAPAPTRNGMPPRTSAQIRSAGPPAPVGTTANAPSSPTAIWLERVSLLVCDPREKTP
jgi:hypothetical protein